MVPVPPAPTGLTLTSDSMPACPDPVLPDYGGACLDGLVPALLERRSAPREWLPAPVAGARQIVLLTLDGLGWEQLQARARLAPTMTSLGGRFITTVAPSTTATALTSLTTGEPPARLAHHLFAQQAATSG